jgi:hydroxymethylpyrimidine/phosphomethylpyrimidine kinase
MKLPCALTIAGSDSGGGAGVQADLKTFAALGVHGLCAITAVTAQNTRGVEAVFDLPPEFVTKQLDAVMRDFDVEWAKTGMLSNAEIIQAVGAGIKRHGLRAVIDPVMASTTGAPLLQERAFESLLKLLSSAELVTPNVPEAEKISGLKIRSRADMKGAARKISELGPMAVLIKGGHLRGREIVDLLYAEGKFTEFKGPRVLSEPTHGTGCSFSAAITAELAKGTSMREAIGSARNFVARAIEGRLEVGKGIMPVNPMAALLLDAEKGRALEEVWAAAKLLVAEPRFAELLPEVGSNIAVALPGARRASDVVGLSGRIVRVGGRPRLTGYPELGGSEHVANIVLTAMRHDSRIRSGLNIRFSDEILRTCRKLGLRVVSFDRSREPRGVKTMIWGTEQAIKKAGGVPDVIFDRGARGKEAMVRLLGRSPMEVAELALRIAKNI